MCDPPSSMHQDVERSVKINFKDIFWNWVKNNCFQSREPIFERFGIRVNNRFVPNRVKRTMCIGTWFELPRESWSRRIVFLQHTPLFCSKQRTNKIAVNTEWKARCVCALSKYYQVHENKFVCFPIENLFHVSDVTYLSIAHSKFELSPYYIVT